MTIGRIVVDLLARTGSFETDMNRSAKLAEKRAKEIDAAVTKAGAAISTAFVAAGAAALAFGKNVIDGLDALNDVKDATGSSIENISALEDVALRTGTTLDNVSGILVKFNGALKEADGKNGVSQALKAIGLDAAELRKEDPAEALRKTAVALAGFADDGNKARLIQELFGKSIKEAAPFLNDLAEKTELVGKVSSEQAANAETFNKQIAELSKNATDAKRALIGDLLPAINAVLKAMSNGGVMGALDEFGERAFGWTSNAQSKRIRAIKDEIDSLARTVERKGVTPGEIVMVRPQDVQELARLRSELKATEAAYFKFDSSTGAGRGRINPPLVDLRQSVGDTGDGGKGAKKVGSSSAPKESEYAKYLENLGKELNKTEDLSRAAMVLADIQSGRLKLLKGESPEPLLAIAKEIDANKALTDEKKRRIEFDNQVRDAMLKDMEAQEDQVKSLTEGNKTMREEIELIGKNAEAQAAIEQARISSAIAIKEEQLARASNTEFLSRESAALEEQIRLLNERKDLVGLKGTAEKLADDAKKTEDLAKNIGAAFSSSFEKAILDGDKLSDVLKGLAKDILALTLRQTITAPLSDSISKGLKGFDFSSIFSGIGSLFSGLKFADGGVPPIGKASIVGERGPELFVPNTAGKIIPNHALGGGGQTVQVNQYFTVGDVASVSTVREAVANSERRIAGQIGRSRQYGGALA